MAAWLKLYSKLSSKTWIGVIGVKGNHTAAAKIENVFPNDEDDENLMYLQSVGYTLVSRICKVTRLMQAKQAIW